MRSARTSGGRGALVAFAFFGFLTLGAARCGYSPDFPSGTLKCSTVHSCPEGYGCDTPSNLCYKNGEGPTGVAGTIGTAGATGKAGTTGTAGTGGHAGTGGATGTAGTGGATGTAGTGGTGGAIATGPDKFVGHWVFDAGSTETVTCTDGSTKDNDLGMDYVDVKLTSGTLTASYFCDWAVSVGPAGDATVIKAGQSCSRNTVDAMTGTTKFTWHGTTFILRTLDGKAATLSSMIAVDYIDDASVTKCGMTVNPPCAGSCTIKLAGTLVKTP